jgi:hypothetical protein
MRQKGFFPMLVDKEMTENHEQRKIGTAETKVLYLLGKFELGVVFNKGVQFIRKSVSGCRFIRRFPSCADKPCERLL